jgi:hypothetical protein
MPVCITCPHCRQDLRLPDDLYAGPAQCPCCAGAFAIRWKNRPRRAASERRPCPFCGEPIKRRAVKCPFCAEWLADN